MEIFAFIALSAPALLIVVLVFLALIVKGIRRADRKPLRNSSDNRLDSITRHVVGGIHNTARDDEDR